MDCAEEHVLTAVKSLEPFINLLLSDQEKEQKEQILIHLYKLVDDWETNWPFIETYLRNNVLDNSNSALVGISSAIPVLRPWRNIIESSIDLCPEYWNSFFGKLKRAQQILQTP